MSVNNINGGHITNYVMCASSCTKPQVHQDVLPFGKILKDENKHHNAVDECLSEQQFHKLDPITFVV